MTSNPDYYWDRDEETFRVLSTGARIEGNPPRYFIRACLDADSRIDNEPGRIAARLSAPMEVYAVVRDGMQVMIGGVPCLVRSWVVVREPEAAA